MVRSLITLFPLLESCVGGGGVSWLEVTYASVRYHKEVCEGSTNKIEFCGVGVGTGFSMVIVFFFFFGWEATIFYLELLLLFFTLEKLVLCVGSMPCLESVHFCAYLLCS